ncbi:hypothetical protein E0Z10_g10238 [Xylaria hypoxylon]|uniref:RING-type domain-containing protein n=1 Tax=Xylaria hypoxylon TaxID=37992 RepID=A0A4Z0Y6Q2_9PEZI|nr:hypothetical protein E0Z10_g10238 [Xylaria hypoxylon]
MATWGGSSREIGKAKISALVANEPLLDGRIAPNSYFPHGDVNTDTNTDTHTNANTYAGFSTSTNTTITTTTTINNGGSGSGNSNSNSNSNNNGDVDDLDSILRAFDDSSIQNFIVNGSIASRYPFSPQPSPPANDSFFATVGDTVHSPFYPTPTTNFPLLHIGGIFHSTLFTPQEPPPPTSLAPAPAPAPTTLALPQALAHPDHHSSFRYPGCLTPLSGGYNFYGHPRNYQPRAPPDIQGSNRSSYPSATPSTSSFATSFATAPTTQSQSHMSTVNPRPIHPTSHAQCSPRAAEAARSINDHFLTVLATQDFSSPSLPPASSSPSPTTLSPSGESKFVSEMPASSTRRRIPNRGGAVDLTKEEPDFEGSNPSVDSSIPFATMPATTRRQINTNITDSTARKRRPSAATSPSRPSKARRKAPPLDHADQSSPFDDDDLLGLNGHDGSETVDLSNATEVPAELMAPKVDNRIKIGKFQCVICMDDTTALTVTHCGHLFCSECLHSSLHIDSMKRTCPVCRSKVDLRDKKKKPVKSYYHLELKVMTATKKGKRPAGT